MWLKFGIVLLLLTIIQSEEDKYYRSTEKNGIMYRVFTRFDVSYSNFNPIPVLTKGLISNIDEVESLSLYGGISKIERGAFENLPKLVRLQLDGCNLEKVENGMFNNLNVTELRLENCHVRTITPDAFDNMITLRKIHFGGNALTQVNPAWFADKPLLTKISLNFNPIEEIPANFIKQSMDELYFAYCTIKRIDDEAFKNVKEIKTLQLAGNQLEFFNKKCLKNVKIGNLGLSQNKIRCLSEEDLEEILVADRTDLQKNPLEPECLKKMKDWVIKNQKSVEF